MVDRADIGHMLVKAGLLSDAQRTRAVEMQKQVGGKLGALIVKLGFITDEALIQFLAKKERLPVVDLATQVIPASLVRRVAREVLERHQVIPVAEKNQVITLATADPTDYEAIEEVQFLTNCRVEIALAPRAAIAKALARLSVQEEKGREDLIKQLERGEPKAAPLEVVPGMEKALIPLLIEKGVISEVELREKARALKFI